MYNQQELATIKRLTEEFNSLLRSPNTNYGITVGLPDKNDMFHWRATLAGPKDSLESDISRSKRFFIFRWDIYPYYRFPKKLSK